MSNTTVNDPAMLDRLTPDDELIVLNLGHTAFMAWLAEARDQTDARYLRLLALAATLDPSASHPIIIDGE